MPSVEVATSFGDLQYDEIGYQRKDELKIDALHFNQIQMRKFIVRKTYLEAMALIFTVKSLIRVAILTEGSTGLVFNSSQMCYKFSFLAGFL